tara:strand:+ start:105 stop:410 length:306 start_codon:yes stop_codon:yes gene_type:complete
MDTQNKIDIEKVMNNITEDSSLCIIRDALEFKNNMDKQTTPNKELNYSEWLTNFEGDGSIQDFLIDNKEFDRIRKEGYTEYLKGLGIEDLNTEDLKKRGVF